MFSTIGYLICIPFAWLLRVFYTMTGSYGMAIVLFTLAVKLVMLPFQIKSKKSMLRMNRLSGKMQEIQKKYANNQMKQQEEIQKLYTEEGVNPMSGCLWSFLPLPILIALYSIIRQPITRFMMLGDEILLKAVETAKNAGISLENIVTMKDGIFQYGSDGVPVMSAYGEINLVRELANKVPEFGESIDGWINMNYSFLGLDLASNPWDFVKNFTPSWACIGLILIPIIAAGSQLLMSWYSMKSQPSNGQAGSMKTMMYMMPLMSLYIAFIMPAALGVYWIAQTIFSMVQEVFMNKYYGKKLEEEENARYEALQADRQRRIEEGKKLQAEHQQQNQKKQTLKEKQKAAQQAKAERAKKAAVSTTEAGRIEDRPYARGRSYKADRYDNDN